MLEGKVFGLEFEIMSKLGSYFLMTVNNFSFQMRYGVCDLKSESWTDLQRDNTRKIMKHRVKNVTQHMVTIGTFLYIRSITKGADWRRKQRWQTVRQILKHLRISSPKAEADSQHSIESITHAATYHLTLTRSIWNKLQYIFSFTVIWMEKNILMLFQLLFMVMKWGD